MMINEDQSQADVEELTDKDFKNNFYNYTQYLFNLPHRVI